MSTDLFCYHVHGVLNATVGDDWEDGGIDYSEVLDAVDFELGVNYPFFNVLGETGCSAWV